MAEQTQQRKENKEKIKQQQQDSRHIQ